MIPKKAHGEEVPRESEVLVTTADPETLPDAAIRLVERRAVRASLKEEQERLKQHEAEAEEILRREKERRDRERMGQDHEVSEKEKKFLAKEAKKKNTKEKKKVLKDKKIVKEKIVQDKKKAVKEEKEKKKPEAEEYSYYTTEDEPEVMPAPKVDDGKRKKTMPKLVAKKPKAKPPTPPTSHPNPKMMRERKRVFLRTISHQRARKVPAHRRSQRSLKQSHQCPSGQLFRRRGGLIICQTPSRSRPRGWLMTRLRWIA